jgi:hypothetical protein
MANEAANAWGLASSITDSNGSGLCVVGGALSDGVEATWQTALQSGCAIWLYTGPLAGHVKYYLDTNPGEAPMCQCPTSTSDPSWN